MSVQEIKGVMKYKDENGNITHLLPATSADQVSGLEKMTEHLADKNNPHGVTTEQIGAAKSDHTHSPESIGAAKADHTHTPESIGAAKSDHTHTLASLGAAPAIVVETTDVTAGSASPYPNGTLYVVVE